MRLAEREHDGSRGLQPTVQAAQEAGVASATNDRRARWRVVIRRDATWSRAAGHRRPTTVGLSCRSARFIRRVAPRCEQWGHTQRRHWLTGCVPGALSGFETAAWRFRGLMGDGDTPSLPCLSLRTSPGRFSSYPNGIASFSPGLRACELPWEWPQNSINPERVEARPHAGMQPRWG